MDMWICVYGGQRTTSLVIPMLCTFVYEIGVSHGPGTQQVGQVGQQASGLACLCLPSTGVIPPCQTLFFILF